MKKHDSKTNCLNGFFWNFLNAFERIEMHLIASELIRMYPTPHRLSTIWSKFHSWLWIIFWTSLLPKTNHFRMFLDTKLEAKLDLNSNIDFEGSWPRFWSLWGLQVGATLGFVGPLGRFLDVFGAFKTKLCDRIGPKWAPRSLRGRFWIHLGRILGASWEDLGGFWETLGRNLWTYGQIGTSFGHAWKTLVLLGQNL